MHVDQPVDHVNQPVCYVDQSVNHTPLDIVNQLVCRVKQSISLFDMCSCQAARLTTLISLLDDVSIGLFDQSFVDQLACYVDQPVLHVCTSISPFDHVDQPVGCCVDQPVRSTPCRSACVMSISLFYMCVVNQPV